MTANCAPKYAAHARMWIQTKISAPDIDGCLPARCRNQTYPAYDSTGSKSSALERATFAYHRPLSLMIRFCVLKSHHTIPKRWPCSPSVHSKLSVSVQVE